MLDEQDLNLDSDVGCDVPAELGGITFPKSFFFGFQDGVWNQACLFGPAIMTQMPRKCAWVHSS